MENRVVEILDFTDPAGGVEPGCGGLTARFSHVSAKFRIGDQGFESLGQHFGVPVFDQEPFVSVGQEFRNASHAGGDNRQSGGHVFEGNAAVALGTERSDDADVEGGHDLGEVVHHPEEDQVLAGQAGVFGVFAQGLGLFGGAATGQDETGMRVEAGDPGGGFEKRALSLDTLNAAHQANDDISRSGSQLVSGCFGAPIWRK